MTPVRRTSRRIQNKAPEMVHTSDPVQRGRISKPVKAPRKPKDVQIQNLKNFAYTNARTRSSASTITMVMSGTSSASLSSGSGRESTSEKSHSHNLRRHEKNDNKNVNSVRDLAASGPGPAPGPASAPVVKGNATTKKTEHRKLEEEVIVNPPREVQVKRKTGNVKGKEEMQKLIELGETENIETDGKKRGKKKKKEIVNAPTTPSSQMSRLALRDVDQLPERQKYVKTRVTVQRTPSMTESFPGRLEWKKKHYDKPVHSTPVSVKTKPTPTLAEDRDSCFGFNESQNSDFYDAVISPIVDPLKFRRQEDGVAYQYQRLPTTTVEPKPAVSDHKHQFEELLHRYKDEADGDLHVNPEGIKVTYSNKHRVSKFDAHDNLLFKNLDLGTPLKSKTKSSRKRTTKKTAAHSENEQKEDKLDPELEKWLTEKNKEFQDIDNVKLVLEKSL